MTEAGVHNDEYHNPALEEGIYEIHTMEFDKFHWNTLVEYLFWKKTSSPLSTIPPYKPY